jgi:anti-sigma B factor antagonist
MEVEVRQNGNVTVVDLRGRVLINNGDILLRDTLGKLLESGRRQILLNMADVGYMDSSGIGEMVAGYRLATDSGGQLKLLGCTAKLTELLEMTRLNRVFETYEDEAEALRSFPDNPSSD